MSNRKMGLLKRQQLFTEQLKNKITVYEKKYYIGNSIANLDFRAGMPSRGKTGECCSPDLEGGKTS